MALALEKKTIIGAKVTREERERILGRCSGLNCNTTDYIKRLVDRDIAQSNDNVYRIKVEGDKMYLPCRNCGGPVPFNLADMGLRPI